MKWRTNGGATWWFRPAITMIGSSSRWPIIRRLLLLERRKGVKALDEVLDDYRAHLLTKTESGRTLESAGPIIWGYRLESSLAPDAWRTVTYEKGTWIIHMLRRRLGDEKFLALLREVSSHHHSISTEEFRDLARQYAPRSPDPDLKIFFDNWVYGTGVPAVKLSYAWRGAKLSGQHCPAGRRRGLQRLRARGSADRKQEQRVLAGYRQRPGGVFDSLEITAHQSDPAGRRLPDDNFEVRTAQSTHARCQQTQSRSPQGRPHRGSGARAAASGNRSPARHQSDGSGVLLRQRARPAPLPGRARRIQRSGFHRNPGGGLRLARRKRATGFRVFQASPCCACRATSAAPRRSTSAHAPPPANICSS